MVRKNSALSFVFVLILCFYCLAACGKEDEPENNSISTESDVQDIDSIKGTDYDTGIVKVSVPEGWNAFDVRKPMSDGSKETDPNFLSIVKGEKNHVLYCNILIGYYGTRDTGLEFDRGFYENIAEITPFEAAGYSWTGFDCEDKMSGSKYTIIEGKKDDKSIKVTVKKTDGYNNSEIEFYDKDVQHIINSIEIRPSFE
ncbi:hypothetical protein SAMN04487934_1333 [Eubacterium ruminantium]|nr:hypothetical protein SAMN04487934_1333 [Eubacterium ruminantium]